MWTAIHLCHLANSLWPLVLVRQINQNVLHENFSGASGRRGYNFAQNFVKADQSYQSHQLLTDLDTNKRIY
eukprot:UN25901